MQIFDRINDGLSSSLLEFESSLINDIINN
jgi:hypothetical protein